MSRIQASASAILFASILGCGGPEKELPKDIGTANERGKEEEVVVPVPATSQPDAAKLIAKCIAAATEGHPERLERAKVNRLTEQGRLLRETSFVPTRRKIAAVWPDRFYFADESNAGAALKISIGLRQQSLPLRRIFAGILAKLNQKLFSHKIGDAMIPVDASEIHVAASGDRRIVIAHDFHHGHVKRTATEVVNQNCFQRLGSAFRRNKTSLHSIRECGGGRFVNDVNDIQTGKATGVLSRLAPRFVKVGGHCDNTLVEGAQAMNRIVPEFAQNQCLNDFGGNLLAGNRNSIADFAEIALGKLDDTIRLIFRSLQRFFSHDNRFAIEEDHAGCRRVTFQILHRTRTTSVVQMSDNRSSGSQIDTDGNLISRHGQFSNSNGA